MEEELPMGKVVSVLLAMTLVTAQAYCADNQWYSGDERCPPPKDDGRYSAPYNAADHPREYPTFSGADKPGWSCSYQREDGVIVQYGNSQTPQEQWLSIYGGGGDSTD
jgi:hypothetical protein